MTPGAQKSLFIALLFAAFLAGLFSAPDHSKEIIRGLKTERKTIIDQLQKKQIEITAKDIALTAERNKRKADSLAYQKELARLWRNDKRHEDNYNKIDLTRHSDTQLDSIRAYLRANPLPAFGRE